MWMELKSTVQVSQDCNKFIEESKAILSWSLCPWLTELFLELETCGIQDDESRGKVLVISFI